MGHRHFAECGRSATAGYRRTADAVDGERIEATIKDGTGEITLVFLGRREVGVVRPGAVITAEGVVGVHRNRAAMLNPAYTLVSTPDLAAHH